jgi:hypothetical protein
MEINISDIVKYPGYYSASFLVKIVIRFFFKFVEIENKSKYDNNPGICECEV